MSINYQDQTIETTPQGYLANTEDWSKGLAAVLASDEDLELTDRHWDIITFLRDQYFNNRENQPNTRAIVKAMSAEWGDKIKQGDLYQLFPGDPSKQGGRIAGLPESRRKGGY